MSDQISRRSLTAPSAVSETSGGATVASGYMPELPLESAIISSGMVISSGGGLLTSAAIELGSIVSEPVSSGAIDPEEQAAAERIATARAAATTIEEQPASEPKADMPVVNEVGEEKPIAKNDCSRYVFAINGTRREMDEAYVAEDKDDTRSDEEKQNEPSDYQLNLATYLQFGTGTSQAQLLAKFVKTLLDEAKKANQPKPIVPVSRDMRLAKIMPRIGNPGAGGSQLLKGQQAKTAVIARLKGVYRVILFNSGFHINIRPMNLAELNTFTNQIDGEFKEIGRILGGYSHLVTDLFIKRTMCEILPNLIVSSNFDYGDDTETLLRNISFHDYDVILWALCTTIFPEGIEMNLTCVNPECRHIDEHQKVSLTDMCFHNLAGIGKEAIHWIMEGFHITRTEADLKKYREEILHHQRTLMLQNELDRYVLQVPTMHEYLKYGEALVANLITLADGEKNISTDQLRSAFTLQLYRMYAPWIKRVEFYDKTTKALQYMVEDTDAIAEALEASSFEGTNFNDDLMKYIRDTKTTMIGYVSLECPKCHKKPNPNEDNFVPVDVQHFFYCLSSRQLEQIGMQS